MDIYEYAMQMEQDGEKFYRELAGNSRVEGLKTIFTMLADEEVKHYQVIAQLHKHAGNASLAKTTVLENVKNVFVRMQKEKAMASFDASDLEAYRKALDIEKMSREFYQDKAADAAEEEVKQLLLRLAGEEEKHCRIMENIVDFVARPEPGNWLEDAEWHHMDEY